MEKIAEHNDRAGIFFAVIMVMAGTLISHHRIFTQDQLHGGGLDYGVMAIIIKIMTTDIAVDQALILDLILDVVVK